MLYKFEILHSKNTIYCVSSY